LGTKTWIDAQVNQKRVDGVLNTVSDFARIATLRAVERLRLFGPSKRTPRRGYNNTKKFTAAFCHNSASWAHAA
jgi:hypothetical protein